MDYPIKEPLIKSAGLITVALLACPPAGSAAENQQPADGINLPSLELLEFLGSFETDSGEWINPGELMQPEFEQLLESIENAPIQASGVDKQDGISPYTDADNEDEV